MAIAALAVVGAAIGGVGPLALVLVGGLWLASLWIDRLRPGRPPEHLPSPPRPDLDTLAREAMAATIGAVGVPLAILDQYRVIAANPAARAALGAHIIDQDARIALRHPDAVRLLSLGDGDSVTIRGLTTARSLWQLTRRGIAGQYWLIEMANRTAEADLGRANTDFVANASHELRTPLASIIGYVETLADTPTVDPATRTRFLEIVLREARRMQNLVDELMSLSRLEAEKHDVPTAEVDLGALAARVVGEFATLPDGPPRPRLVRPETAITVTGDAHQIEQALRNLIDNAQKYGSAKQPVEVEVVPPTQTAAGAVAASGVALMAVLRVTDHGAGIGPEHLPHLTRRFYRTDPGRSRAAGGTGLGLAIVKHVVERHRGKLDIASQPGVGTVVTLRLPVAARPARWDKTPD